MGIQRLDFKIKDLLEMVKGKYPNSKFDREGLVFRLEDQNQMTFISTRASFKVINNDYLEKEK